MTLNWSQTTEGNGNWPAITSPWGFINGIAADINADGFEDLIVFEGDFPTFPNEAPPTDASYPVHFYINDGAGDYVDQTSSLINGAIPETITVTRAFIDDFNGDGRPDLFASDNGWDGNPQPGAPNLLLLSNPDGTFTDASAQLGGGAYVSYSAAIGDVDGDGDLDIYDNAIGPVDNDLGLVTPPVLLINDGSGNFTETRSGLPGWLLDTSELGGITYLSNVFYISQLADLNGDGAAELIVGQSREQGVLQPEQRNDGPVPGTAVVFWNDGAGQFSNTSYTALPTPQWQDTTEYTDIQVFDANGDGHLDVLTASVDGFFPSGFAFTLSLGDGAGGLTDATSTSFPLGADILSPSGSGELRIVDIEHDGDLDIVALPFGFFNQSDRPVVWVNNGNGVFDETFSLLSFPRFSDVIQSPDGNGYNFVWYGDFPGGAFYNTYWPDQDLTAPRILTGDDGFDHVIGGKSDETIRTFGWNDIVFGHGGNDDIDGGDGDDLLVAGDGDDTVTGGAGGDTIDGGAGIDTTAFLDAAGRVLVDLLTDASTAPYAVFYQNGAPEGDTFAGIENATGGRFSDQFRGDNGNNVLDGDNGWDRLYGRQGDDTLIGGQGGDMLYGNNGADVMTGGTSGQRDRFIYFRDSDSGVGAGNRDVITDFQSGVDRIEISRIDADTTQSFKQDFTFIGAAAFSNNASELRYEQTGGATIVQADLNGDGAADFEIELTGTMDLLQSDFLL